MSDANFSTQSEGGGVSVQDIYFMAFRHKWVILTLAAAGFLAAVWVYVTMDPVYKSEAKILVRYIVERKSVNPGEGEGQVKSTDDRGDHIINSELEILSSFDLAEEVADSIGPEKILGQDLGPVGRVRAASLISKSLKVGVPRRGSIIQISFQHTDAEIVQPVLQSLIDRYLNRHVEVYRGGGVVYEYFLKKTDEMRNRLAQTESELLQLKAKAGVISVNDTKKAYIEEISKIRKDLFQAEAELEGRRASLGSFSPKRSESTNATAAPVVTPVPQDKITDYLAVASQLDALRKKEASLLLEWTEQHPQVRRCRAQILALEDQKQRFEAEHPALAGLKLTETTTNGPSASLSKDVTEAGALEAKARVLKSQLEKVQAEAAELERAEFAIVELERRKKEDEDTLRYYASNLAQAKLDEALGPGRVSNISEVQAPSPPVRDSSRLKKLMALFVFGGTLGGVALALLWELYLSPTVKRPEELETKFGLPLSLAIPEVNCNGLLAEPKAGRNGEEPLRGRSKESTISYGETTWKGGRNEIAPWDHAHPLHEYFEALRDRLVADFELKNMTHKPKMVAVTACGHGAGVSTIATGLAASLSEIGDGNVLLVDMNVQQGAAHPLHRGVPGCGLPEVLDQEKRSGALVQEGFYLASVGQSGGQLTRASSKRLAHLVPQMKASDYDYIIFDMPPVGQNSVTSKLGGFMDAVLLVVEADRTNRDVVRKAKSWFSESKAKVSAILNKRRFYVPSWLQKEL